MKVRKGVVVNKILRSVGLFSFFGLSLVLLKFLGIILGAATIGSAVYVIYAVRTYLNNKGE